MLFITLDRLFHENEKRWATQAGELPWSDKALVVLLQRLCPTAKAPFDMSDPNHSLTLHRYRDRYNRGLLSRATPPSCVSFRYDALGRRIGSREGKRVLTTNDQVALLAKLMARSFPGESPSHPLRNAHFVSRNDSTVEELGRLHSMLLGNRVSSQSVRTKQ